MNTAYCVKCGKQTEYRTEERNVAEYRGTVVNVVEDIPVCNECGQEVFVEEVEENNLVRLYNRYEEITGINPRAVIKKNLNEKGSNGR